MKLFENCCIKNKIFKSKQKPFTTIGKGFALETINKRNF